MGYFYSREVLKLEKWNYIKCLNGEGFGVYIFIKKLRYIFFSYAPNNFSNTSPFNPAPDSSELIPMAFGCSQTWAIHFWGIQYQPNGICAGDSNFPLGRLKET